MSVQHFIIQMIIISCIASTAGASLVTYQVDLSEPVSSSGQSGTVDVFGTITIDTSGGTTATSATNLFNFISAIDLTFSSAGNQQAVQISSGDLDELHLIGDASLVAGPAFLTVVVPSVVPGGVNEFKLKSQAHQRKSEVLARAAEAGRTGKITHGDGLSGGETVAEFVLPSTWIVGTLIAIPEPSALTLACVVIMGTGLLGIRKR